MADKFEEKEHLSPISIISHLPHPSYFSLSNLSKVGRPEISTSNPQICRLSNLLDLRTFRNCGNLQICDWQAQYYLRFTDLEFANSIFLQTKTSANPQIQSINESTLTIHHFLIWEIQRRPCNLT
jgi:hypothetical protein